MAASLKANGRLESGSITPQPRATTVSGERASTSIQPKPSLRVPGSIPKIVNVE